MKSLKLYLSLLLVAAFGITGCSDNFDTPPLNSPTATYNEAYLITIEKFKEMYWQDATSYIDTITATTEYPEMYIKGRVISNDEAGNIYKKLVIQDETAALAFSINRSSLYTDYRVGQELVVKVTDLYVGKYAGLMQIGEPQLYNSTTWQATFMTYELFSTHTQLQGWPETAKIDTLDMNIGDLPSTPEGLRKYQSQLVRFTDVHWTEPGQCYATYQTSTNRYIADSNGTQLCVRNSGYADFRSELCPDGEGTVIGLLSYFNNAWQLELNSTADVVGFVPAATDGTKDEPYTVARAIELQGKNKTGWVEGYIVGAVKAGVNTEITSSSDIEWGAPTVLDNTIVIGATATTTDIADAIVVALPDGSMLQKYANLVDNDSVYQRKILINGTLVNYLGTPGLTCTGSASTFEIEGVTISGGSGDEIVAGSGTETSPYNVAQIIAKAPTSTATETGVWTKGYIVGWIDGMTYSSGATFNSAATVNTNILLADTPTETDASKCIPVALPSGTLRTALNLMDNPTLYGKAVSYKGDIIKYFGVPGLKNGTEYKLDDDNSGTGGGTGGGTTTGTLYSFTFLGDANNGGFTIENKTTLPDGLSYVWSNSTSYGWKASGYYSQCYETESWIVSPALTIPAAGANLTFEHALNKGSNAGLALLVSTDKTTWAEVTVPTWPAGTDWTYLSSGTISLSSYAGKDIYIAFKYSSTTSEAATWEIKNFVISAAE